MRMLRVRDRSDEIRRDLGKLITEKCLEADYENGNGMYAGISKSTNEANGQPRAWYVMNKCGVEEMFPTTINWYYDVDFF